MVVINTSNKIFGVYNGQFLLLTWFLISHHLPCIL
jgi:hypothetical protein